MDIGLETSKTYNIREPLKGKCLKYEFYCVKNKKYFLYLGIFPKNNENSKNNNHCIMAFTKINIDYKSS